MEDKALKIGDKAFKSRLLVGTGKYPSFEIMREALIASGTEIVTVAVRRVDMKDTKQGSFMSFIPDNITILPNTAGCYTAEDAVRTAMLAREMGFSNFIKLEVIGDEKTLFPDTNGLISASKTLVKEGFFVMPYTNDDPVVAKKLVDAGCPVIMPLGAPIGSGLGIRNPYNLRIIIETLNVPVIVDAGVGTASDATIAMELGCDGVLINTGIALAQNPVLMAEAMKNAVIAGRSAYLAGRIPKKLYAAASSPLEGTIGS